METRLTDAEAVVHAREGDASAFTVLVESYQEAAFRAAYLILRDSDAAADVAQEAFVRAYQQLGRFREQGAFRPWLLRIVTNLALNELRSRNRRLGVLERAVRLLRREPEPSAERIAATNEEAALVSEALNRLATGDRLVLYLRYFLELDEREMAQVLNTAPGTVKSRLHRAGRRLREVIERDYLELREGDDR